MHSTEDENASRERWKREATSAEGETGNAGMAKAAEDMRFKPHALWLTLVLRPRNQAHTRLISKCTCPESPQSRQGPGKSDDAKGMGEAAYELDRRKRESVWEIELRQRLWRDAGETGTTMLFRFRSAR